MLPDILHFYFYIGNVDLYLPLYPSVLWSTMHTWKNTSTLERGVRDVHFPLIKVGTRYPVSQVAVQTTPRGSHTLQGTNGRADRVGTPKVHREQSSTACDHPEHGGKPQSINFAESLLPKLNSADFLTLNDIDFQRGSNLFLTVFVYL